MICDEYCRLLTRPSFIRLQSVWENSDLLRISIIIFSHSPGFKFIFSFISYLYQFLSLCLFSQILMKFLLLTCTEGCPIPLDFAMIVDTSGSISRRNFKKLIKFIQDMLDGFDISEKGTHIAVVGYSTNASVALRFNDFSGAFLNSANLKRAISNNIKHSRGYTYIDKALKLANTDVFSAKGGMRPNVTKVSKCLSSRNRFIQKPFDF